jgi:hypothetical protein
LEPAGGDNHVFRLHFAGCYVVEVGSRVIPVLAVA